MKSRSQNFSGQCLKFQDRYDPKTGLNFPNIADYNKKSKVDQLIEKITKKNKVKLLTEQSTKENRVKMPREQTSNRRQI